MPIASIRDCSLLIIYCAFIYWLSDQSKLPTPIDFPYQDKLNHAVAYSLMALLAWRCFSHPLPSAPPLALATSAFCIAYGLSDEWHQSFVPGRSAEIADWLTDSTASVLTASCLIFRYRVRATVPPE
jgi:VanZ family protein